MIALLAAAALLVIVGPIAAGFIIARRKTGEGQIALALVDAAGGTSALAGDESAVLLTKEELNELWLYEQLTRDHEAELRKELSADAAWLEEHCYAPFREAYVAITHGLGLNAGGWHDEAARLASKEAAQREYDQERAIAAMDAAIEILADGDRHAKALLLVQSCEWPADWVNRLEEALQTGVLV